MTGSKPAPQGASGLTLLPCGPRALLAQVPDIAHVHALSATLQNLEDHRIIDVVPAARTVLVRCARTEDRADIATLIQTWEPTTTAPGAGAGELTIAVTYDGEDLHDVAELTGLSTTEVVRRHTGATYTVDFLGFAPGFAYLSGLDPALHVSRLPSPRPRVPAGAVAIAGELSAVYPRPSPGGWRLLGRTDEVLFDLANDPPSRLRAGMKVRFEEAP